MKIRTIFSAIIVFLGTLAFGQGLNFNSAQQQPRQEAAGRMSPQERLATVRQLRENLIVSKLNIPPEKQAQFRAMYREYQDRQHQIKTRFLPDNNYQGMTEAEANARLQQSFQIGQDLLDNRRVYTEKFRKIISPQQILQLFQTEGMVRDKFIEKRETLRDSTPPANAVTPYRRP